MSIQKINFPYSTNAVSQKQFSEHLKLYEGYVNKSNEICDILNNLPEMSKANATYSKYRGLKKEETYALNGVILHEEYFKNMISKQDMPQKNIMEIFNRFFGSFDNWKDDFTACAKSSRGWCLTSYDTRTKSVKTFLQDSHDSGGITFSYPLIVLDMYEHAYFMDYGTSKDKYIEKFLDCINWEFVERKAQKILAVM